MKKIYLCVLIILFVHTINAQIITTIAGIGTPGSIGDNGLAINAQLNRPYGMVYDKAGNLYIAEVIGNRVRKIAPNGVITTFVGNGNNGFSGDSGLAINAQLYYPSGLVIDTVGNIYIADKGNGRIRKVSNTGIITTFAGNGFFGYSGDNILATNTSLNGVNGMMTDTLGNVFITDQQNYRLRKVDVNGIITTFAGNGIAGCSDGSVSIANLSGCNALCNDNNGNIYIADGGSNTIKKINPTFLISTITGVCSGAGGYNGDNILAINALIYQPDDIKCDKIGNIYFTDKNNNRVRKIDTAGIITTIVGTGVAGFSGDSGLATSAKINLPYGLIFDACDNLLFTDGWNNRIRKVWFNTDTLPQVNIAVTPNDTVITGTAVTTTATATNHGTIIGYQWVKNGVNASTNSTYTYTPTNGDNVYCIVTVRACTGRMYTDTTITIHITVNSGVGVANTTNYSTHTYPNPVYDVLYVSTTKAQHYTLYNVIGKAVMNGSVDKNNSIDMRAIPTGIYLLQVTDADGQREVIRVVKE